MIAAAAPATSASLAAVAIGASAVLVAAIIAAVAAHYRSKAQLAAESERLQKRLDAEGQRARDGIEGERARLQAQLDAEAERQTAQLAHESRSKVDEVRRGREEEVRKVLADAAIRLTEAIDAVATCRLNVMELDSDEVTALGGQFDQLLKNEGFIAVRLGEAFETRHYREAIEHLQEVRVLLRKHLQSGSSEADFAAMKESQMRAEQAQKMYYLSSAGRVGPEADSLRQML